ncbi:unnamed protein product, partial [Rotaria sordida]
MTNIVHGLPVSNSINNIQLKEEAAENVLCTEPTPDNCQSRLRLAKLLDNNIFKLTSYDGFFNSTIEQINQRIDQLLVGTSNNLPINQIPITQSTILAVEKLNAKYAG